MNMSSATSDGKKKLWQVKRQLEIGNEMMAM